MYNRTCTHWARFFGHIKIAIRQSPIINRRFSLRQRQYFGVRSRILEQLDLIISARDNFALAHDYRPHRYFLRCERFVRLPQCFPHEVLVGQRFKHLVVVATALRAVQLFTLPVCELDHPQGVGYSSQPCRKISLGILGIAHARQH